MRRALLLLLLAVPCSAQELRFITPTDSSAQTSLPSVTASAGRTVLVRNTSPSVALSVLSTESRLIDSLPANSTGEYACDGSTWRLVLKYDPAGGGGGSPHNLLSATHTDTTASGPTDDAVPLGNSLVWAASVLPNCTDTVGQHVNYTAATNAFSCGTTSSTIAANSVEKSVAITAVGHDFTSTITAAWVTATTNIVCSVLGTTADSLTIETIAVAGLNVTASNRIAATSFDVTIHNQYGLEGTVRVQCVGL